MAAFLAPAEYWWGWGDLVFRWLHVVAAIAWIGSSFYFIALDHHLAPPASAEPTPSAASPARSGRSTAAASTGSRSSGSHPRGCPSGCTGSSGRPTRPGSRGSRSWSSSTSPTPRPSSSTARSPTCRPARRSRSRCGGLVARLARLRRASAGCSAATSRALAAAVAAGVVLAAWGASRLLAPQAAYIEVGAMLGTVMAAQRLLRDHPRPLGARSAPSRRAASPTRAGTPAAKQRSVHNNYLTLPVLFAMLSFHFPFTYGARHAWLDPGRADGARRVRPPLLQPAPPRAATPGGSRPAPRPGWSSLAVVLRPAPPRPGRGRPAAALRDRAGDRRRPLRALPLAVADRARLQRAAGGDRARHRAEIRADASLIQAVAVDSEAMPLGNATGMTQRRARRRSRAGSRRASVRRMLEIEAAGMRFRARFEEAEAPATVAAFRAILPFERPDHPLPLERGVELDPLG